MKKAFFGNAPLIAIATTFIAVSGASANQLLGSSGLYNQGTGAFSNVFTVSPANPLDSFLVYTNTVGPSEFDFSNPGTYDLNGRYLATGVATYGELNAMISANVSGTASTTGSASSPLITIYSSDFFYDTLTFYTDTTHSNGTAYLSVTVDGSGSFTGSNGDVYGNSYASVLVGMAGSSIFQSLPSVMNTSAQTMVLSQPIPFTSGVPVDIEVALAANVYFGCNVTEPQKCVQWSASGETDYSHTAILSGIQLVDATGAPINTFTISSASGTSYGTNGVTPEPFSFVLCLSAIVVFGVIRYRKCNTCSVRKPSAPRASAFQLG